jgi:hypothetical protein
MSQGVIDQQRDDAAELESSEDKHTDAVGQTLRRPGRAFKEVVVGVQAVALGVIGDAVGMGILGRASERMLAQAHDPGEQEFGSRAKRGLRECWAELIDDGVEGKYHGPHGGFLVREVGSYPQGYEEAPFPSRDGFALA